MKHLNLSELGNNNLYIIGQYYKKNEQYREYVKEAIKQGRFTILDNGTGEEGEVLTNEELFQLTLEIEPNEVIPLDVCFCSDQSGRSIQYHFCIRFLCLHKPGFDECSDRADGSVAAHI